MVLGNLGPVSTPPKGGHENPAMPSRKIIIIAAVIVLLAGAMFAIFSGGGADVSSSSSSSESNSPAGDGGSSGVVAPTELDNDKPMYGEESSIMTINGPVTVSGMKIVELPADNCNIPDNAKTGEIYVYTAENMRCILVLMLAKAENDELSKVYVKVNNVVFSDWKLIDQSNNWGTIEVNVDNPEYKEIHVGDYIALSGLPMSRDHALYGPPGGSEPELRTSCEDFTIAVTDDLKKTKFFYTQISVNL
ncbi:MAG: hypothetical protein KAS78_00655 [Candidatus Pacebacteria bacterium]|nr:hypothetical protein [Candidatus Paceibacterota bacterium]